MAYDALNGPKNVRQTRYRITADDARISFDCAEGETLLAAAVRHGPATIPVGCRAGGCGMCKVQIVRGSYRTGVMSRAHVSEAEERQGFVLACRTLPAGPVEIRVCDRGSGDPNSDRCYGD